MVQNCEEALKSVDEFRYNVREMDRVLCRKGGHPDEAWWITDQPLHDRLMRMLDDLNNLEGWLSRKKREEEKKLNNLE